MSSYAKVVTNAVQIGQNSGFFKLYLYGSTVSWHSRALTYIRHQQVPFFAQVWCIKQKGVNISQRPISEPHLYKTYLKRPFTPHSPQPPPHPSLHEIQQHREPDQIGHNLKAKSRALLRPRVGRPDQKRGG